MRIFSGMRPTGQLHIGNYLGALRNWKELQKKHQCIFGVVDYHGITTPFDAKTIYKDTMNLVLDYLAVGINPKKSTIIIQSQIPEHTELAWILGTLTPLGELERMTQFKEKARIVELKSSAKEFEEGALILRSIARASFRKLKKILTKSTKAVKDLLNGKEKKDTPDSNEKLYKILGEMIKTITDMLDSIIRKLVKISRNWTHKRELFEKKDRVNIGLLHYPVLMAADILLYKADAVPVGEDQKQHVELARTLARKFNNKFSNVFPLPKTQLVKTGARIMSLTDPTKKMSKTGDESIGLTDSPTLIREKIKTAKTDSGKEIKYDLENKSGISNLLTIYHLFSGKSIANLEKKYKDKGYGEFKKDLAEVIIKGLKPFQEKRKKYEKNPKLVKKILAQGHKKAQSIAQETIKEVKTKMGLL